MRTLFTVLLAVSLNNPSAASPTALPGASPSPEPKEPVQTPVEVAFMGPIAAPIYVNARYAGSLPLVVYLVPGTHFVKAELAPNRFCLKTVEVEAAEGARNPYDDEGPDPFGLPRVEPQLFTIGC
jgi:hypothetical protein